MDNITNMTQKELEKLADLLFDKLMERQEEYDREFEESVQDMFKAGFTSKLDMRKQQCFLKKLMT
jgi:uncharacterized protein YllA (UPF0747 family)